MFRGVLLGAASLFMTVMAVSAAEQTTGRSPNLHGPCYLVDRPRFELFARGTCRCANGQCIVVQCSAEVGGSVELTKGELRARLEAQARASGGMLIGEVQFSLRQK